MPNMPRLKRRRTFRLSDLIITGRHQVTYGFAAMFLTLTVMLCIRLGEWDLDKEPGRCYYARYIAVSYASHPTADTVYVVITAVWMLVAMFSAALLGTRYRRWILASAFLQFPVHLYMTIALRTENQGKLNGEESSENGWDFGQTTAVVLLGAAVEELARKFTEYHRFQKGLRRAAEQDIDEEQGVDGGEDDVEMKLITSTEQHQAGDAAQNDSAQQYNQLQPQHPQPAHHDQQVQHDQNAQSDQHAQSDQNAQNDQATQYASQKD